MTEELTEEEPQSQSRFRGFFGLLRLLFDAVLLVFVMFVIGFLIFVRGIERSQSNPGASADGIVVLTGGTARIDEAMKLLAQGRAKRLLISGVYRGTTIEALKEISTGEDRLFDCCVDIDKEALNTIDNATETAQWAARNHYGSLIVVTSNYHMPRTLAELGRVMPSVRLVPYAVVAENKVRVERWWSYPGTTKLLLREYVKFLPALGRLAATQAVSVILTGKTTVAAEDASEP